MARWLGFGVGFSLILLALGSILFLGMGADDRQYAREQAAIERTLAQERMVAQRQQYDQERWQLTLVAITGWIDRADGWVQDAGPFVIAILLVVILSKNKSITIVQGRDDENENW